MQIVEIVEAREDPKDRNALSIVCKKSIDPVELSRIVLMYCPKPRTTQRSDAIHSRILTAADNPELKIPLILLIDDDADTREMYTLFLTHHGFRCLGAADADDGLRLARDHQPSVILLDVWLPGIDGWAVAASLKKDAELRDIPIVMLTAEALPEDREHAAAVGASGFLTKPVLPDDVVLAVRRLLQL